MDYGTEEAGAQRVTGAADRSALLARAAHFAERAHLLEWLAKISIGGAWAAWAYLEHLPLILVGLFGLAAFAAVAAGINGFIWLHQRWSATARTGGSRYAGRRLRIVGSTGAAVVLVGLITWFYFKQPFREYAGYMLSGSPSLEFKETLEECSSHCKAMKECKAFSFANNGSCIWTDDLPRELLPRRGVKTGVRAELPKPRLVAN
jgi:hypothetical protein